MANLPLKEVTEKYKEGATLNQLSREYHYSTTTIWNFLRKHGVNTKRKRKKYNIKKPGAYSSISKERKKEFHEFMKDPIRRERLVTLIEDIRNGM